MMRTTYIVTATRKIPEMPPIADNDTGRNVRCRVKCIIVICLKKDEFKHDQP